MTVRKLILTKIDVSLGKDVGGVVTGLEEKHARQKHQYLRDGICMVRARPVGRDLQQQQIRRRTGHRGVDVEREEVVDERLQSPIGEMAFGQMRVAL